MKRLQERVNDTTPLPPPPTLSITGEARQKPAQPLGWRGWDLFAQGPLRALDLGGYGAQQRPWQPHARRPVDVAAEGVHPAGARRTS